MAYVCQNCGKGRAHGYNVSHAKNRTHRLFLPNLQTVKMGIGGITKSFRFCAKCIKKMKQQGKLGYKPVNLEKEKPVSTPKSEKHLDRDEKKTKEKVKKEAEKKAKGKEKTAAK